MHASPIKAHVAGFGRDTEPEVSISCEFIKVGLCLRNCVGVELELRSTPFLG
jgi:hypothetical protein